MKLLLLTILLLAGAAHAQTTIGLHTWSLHTPSQYEEEVSDQRGGSIPLTKVEKRDFEKNTFGAFVRLGNGLTAGAYRNSYRKLSAYAGWTFETPTSPVSLGLTVGGITGYDRGLRPLFVPSIRLSIAEGWGARVAVLPGAEKKGATAVHLMLEKHL